MSNTKSDIVVTGNVQATGVGSQLDIGANQTTGILNIGTGVRTTTGAINIGTGSTSSAINIGNKTGTTNTVVINSGSAGITLASTGTAGLGINVKGNAIDTVSAGVFLDIGTTNATGGIAIGNSTQTNITVGGITVGNNIIRASAVGNNMGFATTTTTGDITIGAAQTAGLLSIGTATRIAGGNINIGTASTGNAINIGNKTDTTNTVAIKSGSAGITLASGTALAGLKVSGNTVDVVTATEALDIGTSQLTGILNIGTGVRTGVGAINIGTNNASSEINIGKSNNNGVNKVTIGAGTSGTTFYTGASPTNGINIASTIVDTVTTGTLSLGTASADNVSIGSTTSNVNIKTELTSSGDVNIATGTGVSQSTTVNIGSGSTTGTVKIGGASNVVELAKPPTLSYTTLPTFTPTQIGYTLRAVLTVNTAAGATTVPIDPFSATTFTLGVGVWSMTYSIQFRGLNATTPTTITKTTAIFNLATVQNNINTYGFAITRDTVFVTNAGDYAYSGSAIIVNDTASNVLTPSITVDYTPVNSCQFRANNTYLTVTRIA